MVAPSLYAIAATRFSSSRGQLIVSRGCAQCSSVQLALVNTHTQGGFHCIIIFLQLRDTKDVDSAAAVAVQQRNSFITECSDRINKFIFIFRAPRRITHPSPWFLVAFT